MPTHGMLERDAAGLVVMVFTDSADATAELPGGHTTLTHILDLLDVWVLPLKDYEEELRMLLGFWPTINVVYHTRLCRKSGVRRVTAVCQLINPPGLR